MAVSPGQLAQHERVKPIGLPARDPEASAGRGDLVGVQRQHPQPRVQQPLDQQPVRTLDRDQRHLQTDKLAAQRPQSFLVVRKRGRQKLLARLVGDQHVVLLGRPINTGVVTHVALLWSGQLHSAPTRRYRCGTP
jgi:hypothetical protein